MLTPPPSIIDRALLLAVLITATVLIAGGAIATMRAEAPRIQEDR